MEDGERVTPEPPAAGAGQITLRSRSLALAGLCTGAALVVLDANVLNVAAPTIRRDMGGTPATLLWVIDSYTLTFAVLLLSSAALGDRLGGKKVFQAGLAVFGSASLAASIAPDPALLIASRALQGTGAALLAPASLALIATLYPQPTERARAVGMWAGVSGIGFAGGPVLGGVLVAAAGWRSVFVVNLPVTALAMWLVGRHLDRSPSRDERFDPVGQVLAGCAVALVVLGLVDTSTAGWSPTVLAILAAGVALLALFWFAEHLFERQGRPTLMAPSLLAGAAMRTSLGAAAAYNFALYGMLIAFSIVLQAQRHYSALQAGLAFLPLTVVGAATSGLLAGRLVARYTAARVLATGMLTSAGGALILASFGSHAPYWQAAAGFVVFGTGTGLSAPAMTAAVLTAAGPGQASRASGVLNAARQLGGAFGVALLGSLVAKDATHLPLAMVVAALGFVASGAAVLLWAGRSV